MSDRRVLFPVNAFWEFVRPKLVTASPEEDISFKKISLFHYFVFFSSLGALPAKLPRPKGGKHGTNKTVVVREDRPSACNEGMHVYEIFLFLQFQIYTVLNPPPK